MVIANCNEIVSEINHTFSSTENSKQNKKGDRNFHGLMQRKDKHGKIIAWAFIRAVILRMITFKIVP